MKLLIYYIGFGLTLLNACGHPKYSGSQHTNFTDTIRKTQVIRYPNGDSLIENEVITFMKNDLTVPMDSFFYEPSGRDYNERDSYRIYFDRKKVITYCDSMLNALGNLTPNNFNAIQIYNSILTNARQGYAEIVCVSETHYLMNRFTPLIINRKTGYKPIYYFKIDRKSSQREDIKRHFVTEKGDTLSLSWENVWLEDDILDVTK